MNMQKKILDAIKKKAEDAGFEWVVRPAWANTGNVYIQKQGEFVNAMTFHYDFQDSRCSFQFYPGDTEPVGTSGFTHEKALKHYGYLPYTETARINEMLAFVETYLKEQSCNSQSGKKSSASQGASPKASGAP